MFEHRLAGWWVLGAVASLAWSPPAGAQCAPVQVAAWEPADGHPRNHFGAALARDGDLLLVGADGDGQLGQQAGAAYLYDLSSGTPVLVEKLVPDPGTFQYFGASVDLVGDTAVVGSWCTGATACDGEVFVFERDFGGPGAWGLRQKLTPAPGVSEFGLSVAADPLTLLVGADALISGGQEPGRVVVFERATLADDWVQVQEIFIPDAHSTGFGRIVTLDGDTAVFSADYEDGAGTNTGALYVFERNGLGTSWVVKQRLTASVPIPSSYLGTQLAYSGDRIAATSREGLVGTGAVYVFERDALTGFFGETARLTPSDPSADLFGLGLDVSDDLLVAGSPSAPGGGAAFVFERRPGGWVETHVLQVPGLQDLQNFGEAIELQARSAVIGAPSLNLVTVFAGQAYLFDDLAADAPSGYCTAGTSQNGCQPALSSTGFAHLSAPTGFRLDATGLDGQRTGLLFWGTTTQAKPWGTGSSWFCVVPPVVRTAAQNSGGTSGACDGALTLDFNAWMSAQPLKAPVAGTLVHTQGWYRDPGSSKNSALTAGLSFLVCP